MIIYFEINSEIGLGKYSKTVFIVLYKNSELFSLGESDIRLFPTI